MTSLSDWTQAYLRDARESGAIDSDTPDAVIDREAENLDGLIFKLASSFVDNEFDASEPEPEFTSCEHPGPRGCQTCDACACWGDDEYHRRRDEGYF